MASSFSLFDELTKPRSSNRPQATDLVLNLLHAVGYEACQTKRNTHYVYSIVSGLRDAYDDVNGWIYQIDSEAVSDPWDLFTQYTRAINPLEEWLSELLKALEESCNKEKAYAGDQDLGENCFNHVRSFEKIRDALKKTVEQLDQHFGKKSTRARYLLGDDYIYLQNVRNKFGDIQGIGGRHGSDLVQKLNDAITLFAQWSASPSQVAVADRVATKGIQIWMLIHAVIDKGTATAAPSDLKAFLDTDELWKELVKAAELVNSHFSNPELAFEDLEKGYEDLIACLAKRGLSGLPKLLPDYLEVVKLVAKTARPYFAQAVVLAKECQQLANVHSKNKLQERHRIEKAVGEVKKALIFAKDFRSAENALQLSKSPDVDGRFEQAHQRAKKCIQALKLTGTDWDKEMKHAKEDDAHRKEDFEEHVKPRIRAQEDSKPKQPKASVTVTIETLSKGASLGTRSFKVEKTTKLNSLLWDRIRTDEADFTAYFIKSKDESETRLNFDMEVGNVNPGDEVALVLVINDEEEEYEEYSDTDDEEDEGDDDDS